MPNAVERVVGKRQSEEGLDADLGDCPERSERRSKRGGVEVPPEHGGREVGGCEEVEGPREHDSRDTVRGGAEPGDLGSVDGEVGGDGAAGALLGEDLGGIGGLCAGDVVPSCGC